MIDEYKESSLGLIPKNWDVTSIESICSVKGRIGYRGYTKADLVKKSEGALTIGAKHISNNLQLNFEDPEYISWEKYEESPEIKVEIGDILFVQRGSLGKAAMVKELDEPATINPSMVLIKKIKCNRIFLYYCLTGKIIQDEVLKVTTSTAVPMISQKQIKEFRIPLPPLPEQQKIANILTTVDDKLENIESQIAEYTNLKTGLMQQLLTKGIGHKKFVDSELGMIPEGWEVVKLDDCAEINMGQSPESKFYNDKGDGNYLIQGNADIKNRQTTPRIWTSNLTKECKIGDIIMTVRAPVGAIAKSLHNACIGRGVCSIKPKEINAEFLYQFLISYESKWTALEQGSTFTAVNGKDIRGIAIPKPPPLEQQRISAILSSVDEKLESLQSKKEECSKLKKGLMEQLLTGRIRVKV